MDNGNNEKKYKNLIDNASVGIITYDKQGFISYANQAFCKITEYTNEYLIKKNILSIIHYARKDADAIRLKKKMSGKSVSPIYKTKILTKKGNIKYLNFASSVIKKNGKIVGAEAMVYDITSEILSTKENENNLIYEKLISNASYRSLVIKDFNKFINKTLKDIGLKINASRVYVFKINFILNTASNTHEWCNKGISKEIKNSQNIPLDAFPRWLTKLKKDKLINVSSINSLKNKTLKKFLSNQHIKSILLIPITTSNGLYGFVGFDECKINVVWSEKQIKVLRIIANIISQILNNKILQNEILDLKEHYKQIVDTIQDGIFVINNNFKIIRCNKAFAKKTNLPIKKIVGSSCRTTTSIYNNNLLKNFCKGHVKNNYPNSHGCAIAKAFSSKKATSFTEKGYDDNNRTHYHRINVFPAIDKQGEVKQVVTTIRDITTKMRAEENFKKLSEFNQSILDNIPVSIITLDKKGHIISANKLAAKLMGKDKNEILNRKLANTKTIKNNPELYLKYKSLLKYKKPFNFFNVPYLPEKNNKTKYLNIICVPILDNNKKFNGAISMALDNTDAVIRKQEIEKLNEDLEKKVIERTWQLDKVNQELYDALDLKSKFIADASHELRTPLTILQGNLDLMNSELGKTDSEVNKNIGYMKKEVRLMSKILSDLALLTSEKINFMKFDYEKIEISNLISIVCQSLKVLANKKNIKIKYTRLPKTNLMGDETNLEKLFLNILRNAIKYGKNNGHIYVKLVKQTNKVEISISDNGIGIPSKDLPNIFERFYRVSKSRSRKEGGIGLGLSIAKWITEAHGGFIEVNSEHNKGSIFTIHLPYNYRSARHKKTLF